MNTAFPRRLRATACQAAIGMTLILLALPLSLNAQQSFATLEEQMTGEQFQAAGLDKLSPQELASLNAWIRSRSLAALGSAPGVPSVSAATSGGSGISPPDIEDMEREPIVSRIKGNFAGWDGQTIFQLENGKIWAQVGKDKFFTEELVSPVVTIEPAMFGTWKLRIEGLDEDCKVERIQ